MTGASNVAELSTFAAYMSAFACGSETSNGMRNATPVASYSATTTGAGASYRESALPRNLDIFSEVEQGLSDPDIADDQRRLAHKLILALKANLIRGYQYKYMDLPYSTLHLSVLEDGSILIEWAYLNLRAGFSIERSISESSYYVLLKDREDGVSTIVPEYGPLNSDNVERIAAKIVACISKRL